MKEKNRVFAKVFDWLYQQGKAIDQTDIARKTGISATTISRIMNHGVGRPDEKTIRKFNAAFGNIFNPDFLRGQSDEMFVRESKTIVTEDKSVQVQLPDYSSLMNATIAAQQTSIESLKRELADKDESASKAEASAKRELAAKQETIDALRNQLKDKDKTISAKDDVIVSLRQHLDDLRNQLRAKDATDNYPFTTGVADKRPIRKK